MNRTVIQISLWLACALSAAEVTQLHTLEAQPPLPLIGTQPGDVNATVGGQVIFTVEGEPFPMSADLRLDRLRLIVVGGEEAGTVADVYNS